jgi:predicted DsbA family dithiol-disulfide isomerase
VLAEWMRERFGATITWLPFDLHPEYPPEGLPRADLHRRLGDDVDEHMRAVFERNGLVWNPPDVIPNSRDALRVAELARDERLHTKFHDRVMEAHWAEGANIGEADVLRALATEVGLDDAAVERVLGGDEYAGRVQMSTQQAAYIGISGIPAFLLDDRLLVLGAQPREVFESAFERLA